MAIKPISILCGARGNAMSILNHSVENTSNTRVLLFRALPRLSCARNAHAHRINKNLSYISNEKMNITADLKTMKLSRLTNKPLCIILNWLLAKEKQVMKYAKIYLDEGFDVLSVSCEPWQLLWPAKGTKVIGRDLLELMYANDIPYMVHGFSVGGYVWSEAMLYAMSNKEKYQPALDRVEAQVWDSVTDITQISVGVPLALFPDNKPAQTMTKTFIKYNRTDPNVAASGRRSFGFLSLAWSLRPLAGGRLVCEVPNSASEMHGRVKCAYLKAFYNVATVHYQRACELYYASPCRAPALFLLSSTDPVGNERRIRRACDLWIQRGIKCTWQCWARSPHIQHYLKHPEEYAALLRAHIRNNVSTLYPKYIAPCAEKSEKIKFAIRN